MTLKIKTNRILICLTQLESPYKFDTFDVYIVIKATFLEFVKPIPR